MTSSPCAVAGEESAPVSLQAYAGKGRDKSGWDQARKDLSGQGEEFQGDRGRGKQGALGLLIGKRHPKTTVIVVN